VWFAVVIGLAVAAGRLLALAEGPAGATGVDRSITTWVVRHRTDWLTPVARGFSLIGSQKVLIPVVAIVAAALLARRRISVAVVLVVVWAGAIGIYSLVKAIVGRPRPPEAIWLTRTGGKSFPSGHAVQSLSTLVALTFVAAVVLPRTRRPAWVVIAILVVGIGSSRVYLGVHWTTDVIGGWLIAALWAGVVIAAGARTLAFLSHPSGQNRQGS
jgi:undecaprenyl-diphosphatase